MVRSIPSSVPKYEVDESRLENLHNDPNVVRHERPDHTKKASRISGIRVMPGTDIFELMGRDPEFDDNDEYSSRR